MRSRLRVLRNRRGWAKDSGNTTGNGTPVDLKQEVFGKGLTWLAQHLRRKPDTLRSLLGRRCRDFGDAEVLAALATAQSHNPIEPIAWIEQRLKTARRRNYHGVIPMHPGAGG